jgi:5-methylcytosine-specific restriction endonuclease McrA
MNLKKYTLQELSDAIKDSVSMRQVLAKLNVIAAGGNYATLKKAITYFNLDISHFTGQNLSGRKLPLRRKTIDQYLTKNSTVQSNKLRKYLLEENIFQPVCMSCGLSEWLSNKIPLELDHINGDNTDNELCNLRLLCPNCHALTPTYRGRNIKRP